MCAEPLHPDTSKVNEKKSKKTRSLLAEAQAKLILTLIENQGFLNLSGSQYRFLRYRYGMGKLDVDRGLNRLLEIGKISVTTNSGGLILEPVCN